MEKQLNSEMGDFAQKLAQFFTIQQKPTKPIRLNKRMKEILLEMMQYSLDNTSVHFWDDKVNAYESFMEAMQWLKCQINRKELLKVRLSARVGWQIQCWISDNRFHPLSGEPDYDKALDWVMTKIYTKYSPAALAQWASEKRKMSR